MRKRFLKSVALILALSMMLLSGCGNSKEVSQVNQENSTGGTEADAVKTTIRVGVATSGFAYPFYVGQEKGFFEKYGIELVIDSYGNGGETIDATVLQQEDMGEGMDYAIVTRLVEGSNLQILSFMAEANPTREGLYVQGGINEIKDIEGKRIAVRKGSINEYVWKLLLDHYEIPEDSVERVELSSDAEIITAFVNNDVDAIWIMNVYKDQLDEAGTNYTNLGDLSLVGVSQKAFILMDKAFVEQNPEVTENFLKGVAEAEQFLLDNPEESAEIVYKKMAIEKDTALSDIDNYNWDIRFTQEDYDHLLNLSTWVQENGLTKSAYDVKDFVNYTPLKSAIPDKVNLGE